MWIQWWLFLDSKISSPLKSTLKLVDVFSTHSFILQKKERKEKDLDHEFGRGPEMKYSHRQSIKSIIFRVKMEKLIISEVDSE